MYFFVVLALLGWPLISIYFFRKFREDEAVIATVMLGTLFLPVSNLEIPFFIYEKDTVIGLSVLLGSFTAKKIPRINFVKTDYTFFIYSTLVPFLTSMSNQLGIVDAYYSILSLYLVYWVIYNSGRKFFFHKDSLFRLCKWIVIGGVLYVPLCLYEVRMSPQLSINIYGFFAHSFLQHFRYGGYRPIVFMNHGLMVALWMASASITSFWLWRSRKIRKILFLPMWVITPMLCMTTVLCKSANGVVFMVVGIGFYYYVKISKKINLIKIIIYLIPLYIIVRVFDIISADSVGHFASYFFDSERIQSLLYRLRAEDLYGKRALIRPLFGWGGWGRNRPIDPYTGSPIRIAIDSFFLINFSRFGFFGLITIYYSFLFAANRFLRERRKLRKYLIEQDIYFLVISIIIIFYMSDSLLNSMVNPIYILCTGVLMTQLTQIKKRASNGKD